jgi:hypothetical protein
MITKTDTSQELKQNMNTVAAKKLSTNLYALPCLYSLHSLLIKSDELRKRKKSAMSVMKTGGHMVLLKLSSSHPFAIVNGSGITVPFMTNF